MHAEPVVVCTQSHPPVYGLHVVNDFRPTSRKLCATHDSGRKKRKADATFELQAE